MDFHFGHKLCQAQIAMYRYLLISLFYFVDC